jgi:hypothetical protein
MATLQSRGHKKWHSRWDGANTTQALTRKHAKADALRLEAPPPIYPAEMQPGAPTGDYIYAHIRGVDVRIELNAPRPTVAGIRPRTDQWCVIINGVQWSPAAGLVGVFDELRERVPRTMSRRAIATIER